MLIKRASVTKVERGVEVHPGIHAATVTQQWGPAIHQEWGPVLGAETPGWSTADDCNANYMLPYYSRIFQFSRLNTQVDQVRKGIFFYSSFFATTILLFLFLSCIFLSHNFSFAKFFFRAFLFFAGNYTVSLFIHFSGVG